MYLKTLFLSAVILLQGCKLSQSYRPISGEFSGKRPNKFRVAVIDDGFDDSLEVFKGKLIASFRLRCIEDKNKGLENDLPYEELKRKALEYFGRQESGCQLVRNINFKKSLRFAEIRSLRDTWNRYFLNKEHNGLSEDEVNNIYNILDGEGRYNYHGTSVASLIAYKNPNVELIFIQKELKIKAPSEMECFTKDQLTKFTRLYRDPDIIKAYTLAPLDQYVRQMDHIMTEFEVDFVNTSFGTQPTKAVEALHEKMGCQKISFHEYHKALYDMEEERDKTVRRNGLVKSKALTVKAFGNDSLTLNSNGDGEECSMVYTINVAATDAYGNIANFSNRGKCADVFVPGEGIIASSPEGFLIDVSGTSVSSPLFIRYLTLHKRRSNNYYSVYQRYKGSQILLSKQIPTELILGNTKQIDTFSLTRAQRRQPKKRLKKLRLPFGKRLERLRLPFGLR